MNTRREQLCLRCVQTFSCRIAVPSSLSSLCAIVCLPYILHTTTSKYIPVRSNWPWSHLFVGTFAGSLPVRAFVPPRAQLLALPPSGEKIIFPLLDPMLHAYRPVMETLRGGGSGGGRSGDGDEGLRMAEAVGIEEGEVAGISCPVSIIYGSPDQDWMPSR